MSGSEWRIDGLHVSLSRRRFVLGIGAAGAGAAAAALIPATAPAAVAPGIEAAGSGVVEDWSIDDVWGLYPRYSAPIGFGRPREGRVPALADASDPQLAQLAAC